MREPPSLRACRAYYWEESTNDLIVLSSSGLEWKASSLTMSSEGAFIISAKRQSISSSEESGPISEFG